MEADRRDHVQFNPYKETGIGRYVWGGAGALLAVVLIGLFFLGGHLSDFSAKPSHDFSKVYAGLGVTPLSDLSDDAYRGLLKLEREPCEKTGIYSVAEYAAKTDPRWGAEAYYGFASRCGSMAEGDMKRASSLFVFLGDHQKGLIASNSALKNDNYDPDLHYYRAQSLAGLGRFAEAIPEYQRVIGQLGSKTGASVYSDEIKAYAAVGSYCDAKRVAKNYIDSNRGADGMFAVMLADNTKRCPTQSTVVAEAPTLNSATVPRFSTRTPYKDVRKTLLQAGWRPAPLQIGAPRVCDDDRPDICKPEWTEVEDCSGNGAGFCAARWQHGSMIISVTTAGVPARYQDWECAEHCRK